mgnify:FL=1
MKLTKEEFKKTLELSTQKSAILNDIGLLHTQIHTLSHYYNNAIKGIDDNSKVLQEKYGKIKIDLNNGTFVKE